ncbi:MAG: rod shape-determining protein MreD [Burkholderiales bacterium]|nr:rod shape-determining protein MreD [Burkholderiales bacterium]MDE2290271.1 rod shape-determining protein MreD [Burkholderiales bacterium]MDE2608062.1 rod shape-determining protein MreD [Burkholderiales bacterium]
MTRPQYILLPVNPYFIAISLIAAFLVNLMPWGDIPVMPDFVALVLIFWNIHQPRKVGMGIAFIVGLLMDVHNAGLLGEHALAYTLLSYGAIMIHRRVLWFTLFTQALLVLPLLLLAHLVPFLIRLATGAPFPGWWPLLAAFVEAALWPIVSILLLAPQKRAVDRDDTRPI